MPVRLNFLVQTFLIRNMSIIPTNLLKDTKVEKIPMEKIFRLKLNGSYGTIEYTNHNDIYDLVHTNIPEEFSGKGIGGIMAEKTFQHIINEKKRMVLTCEFLQHYYQKNKDKYKAYVEE